jgi:hypothetical protein
LAGHFALLCAVAIHEFGHGVTALLLGGDFKDLFISSFGGQAGASAPGRRNAAVLAAGSTAELLAGLAAWLWLQQRLRPIRPVPHFDCMSILIWLFATQAVLGSLTYVTFTPAIQAIFGFTTGDWPLLLGTRPALHWIMLATGLAAAVPISAVFVRAAPRLLAPAHAGIGRKSGSFAVRAALAFAILLLPSRIWGIASAIVLLPWLDQSLAMILGRSLHILLFAVAGALWIGWRARRTASGTVHAVERSPRAAASRDRTIAVVPVRYWNASLVAAAVAVVVVFGPTEALRRGLVVSPPSADDYIGVAQQIRLQLTLLSSATPAVSVCSRPVPDAGSRYRRQLTQALASRGPSVAGARELSAFIARWNLGGGEVGKISTPESSDDEWCWVFDLARTPNPVEIAVWPVTWIRDSHIRELRITGGRIDAVRVPNVRIEKREPAVLVWSRPEDMETVQRFEIYWR